MTILDELAPTTWSDRERDEAAKLEQLAARTTKRGATTLTPRATLAKADAIAERMRAKGKAEREERDRAAQQSSARIAAVKLANQVNRADRAERRAFADEPVRRAKPTRLTSAEERAERRAYQDWTRPDGVAGGPLIYGYVIP